MNVIRFSLRRKLVYGRYFFRVKVYTDTRSRYTHGKLPVEEKNALAGAAAEVVQRYGSANKEFLGFEKQIAHPGSARRVFD